MAITAHPHPASYLAFACFVTETDEFVEQLLSWCVPPEAWADLTV